MNKVLIALFISALCTSQALAQNYRYGGGFGGCSNYQSPSIQYPVCGSYQQPTYASSYTLPGSGITTTQYSGGINASAFSYTLPGTGITTTTYTPGY